MRFRRRNDGRIANNEFRGVACFHAERVSMLPQCWTCSRTRRGFSVLTNYFRVTDVQLRNWCDSNPVLTKDFDPDQIPCEEHLDLSSQTSDLIGWLVSAYCRCVEGQNSAAISVAFDENCSEEDRLRDILQIAKADVPGFKTQIYSEELLAGMRGGKNERNELTMASAQLASFSPRP